jgi:hypothetical protein
MTVAKTAAMLLVLVACKSKGDQAPSADQLSIETLSVTEPSTEPSGRLSLMSENSLAQSEGAAGAPGTKVVGLDRKVAAPALAEAGAKDDKDDDAGGEVGGEQAPARSWFPETFLFEPRIVTDDRGTAVVPVKVPDRLTTWRVLALAHARTGAQGGAVTSFLGTLPAYIDPIVPPFLIAGDVVKLPIQIVNTTEAPITGALSLQVQGADVTAALGGTRTIPAQGSLVEYATIRAARAGRVQLRASLGASDAVERGFDVMPAGKPERVTRTGTLAAPRTFTIEGPAGSDPATDRVRLLVYPGALGLVRAELAASSLRGSVADDAYALLLAGKAPDLLAALGDRADPDALRGVTLVAAQRAIRAARVLDVTSATLLAEAALAHPQNAVLARLGERAAAYLAQQQRPDGTFAGGTGWTLQRVLVATADGTRAVAAAQATSAARQRAQGVRVRAQTAFERNLEHVQDGYTAAAILASGVAGAVADKLRAKVRESIVEAADGTKYLDVPAGVVRADGSVPRRAEATALAVLALAGAADAPLADLGSTLLGSYDPLIGWGDGRANLAAMQAVLELFKTPIPDHVTVTLTMDGKPVTSGTLDGSKLRDVLILDVPAPGLAGTHTWQLTAEPAVPGLGFSLTAHAWTPWPRQPVKGGLELAVPGEIRAAVGKPVELAVSAIAPSGMPLRVHHALPAGVHIDRPSLQALVDAGTIQRFLAADGKVELDIAPLSPGQTFSARYRVIPTFAGTLRTSASVLDGGTTQHVVPPATWTIQ